MKLTVEVEISDRMAKLLKKSHIEILNDALTHGFQMLAEKCADEVYLIREKANASFKN